MDINNAFMDRAVGWLLWGTAIFTIVTVVIPILIVYMTAKAKQKMKEANIKFAKEQERIFRDQWDKIYKKELEPYYLEAVELFKIKKRKFDDDEAEILIELLYDSMGTYGEWYKKCNFEGNKLKEIFTIMKNKHIDKQQWENIINFIGGH